MGMGSTRRTDLHLRIPHIFKHNGVWWVMCRNFYIPGPDLNGKALNFAARLTKEEENDRIRSSSKMVSTYFPDKVSSLDDQSKSS